MLSALPSSMGDALPFGEAAPDALRVRGAQSECEAIEADRAVRADAAGDVDCFVVSRCGMKQVRVAVSTGGTFERDHLPTPCEK